MGDDAKPTVVDRPGAPPRPAERRGSGRYTSGDEIARGGMGRVVEATDTLLDRVVAVKEALTGDPEALRRFARETKITARLEHPSIVPVYDAGTDGGAPFYVMRRVTGRPLAELIADAPTLADRLALVPHVLAAAHAVAHAHSRGIIHRDIKPANILVGELGETVVIDWGLAKVVGEPEPDDPYVSNGDAGDSLRTRVGTVFGTPGFMSPGQVRGEPVGPDGDVYALGATLYYLLAGKPPHHAKSGDEMMSLAAAGAPTPLARLVSGVPPELSTIVDKALAYDGADRYPDAGAFAEDLRRFSTGQLVASHRYSRRERLVRFVRRHRGAVAIGALSIIALAIVAWIAVARVIAERDRADAQAELATMQQRAAEAARTLEHERADQLLLLRARTLVDTNPTAAVALLKQLAPTSPRIAEARAVSSAAAMRGVAWGLRGTDELTIIAELDPEARRLLQVSKDGDLRVWDLDRHALVLEKQLRERARAAWALDGTRILLYGEEPTALFDPATGAVEPLALPRLRMVDMADRGDVAAVLDEHQQAGSFDLATRKLRPLPVASPIRETKVAPDGSLIVVTTKARVTVFDRGGVELTHHDGANHLVLTSRTRRVAVIVDDGIVETVAGPGSPWRRIDLATRRNPLSGAYRDDELDVMLHSGQVVASRGESVFERWRFDATTSPFSEVGDDQLIFADSATSLVYFNGVQKGRLALPHALKWLRIATRHGRSRIAVVGSGTIFVIDLQVTLPRRVQLAKYVVSRFIDEETLIAWSPTNTNLVWHEVPTGVTTPIQTPLKGFIDGVFLDVLEHRALVVESTGTHRTLFEARKGELQLRTVFIGKQPFGHLVPGGAIVFADGNVLYGRIGDAPPRQLASFAQPIDSIIPRGPLRYAASAAGEVVRGDLATNQLDRTTIPGATRLLLASDREGHLWLGLGDRLLRWDVGVDELARLGSEIRTIQEVDGGLLVMQANHISSVVELPRGAPVHRVSSRDEDPRVTPDGRLMTVRRGGYYEIIELPSRASWSTPIVQNRSFDIDLAPHTRRILQRTHEGTTWIWQLPGAHADLATGLDTLTNATEDRDGMLVWPWQRSK